MYKLYNNIHHLLIDEAQDIGDTQVYNYIAKMPDGPEKDAQKQSIISGIKEDLMNPDKMLSEAVSYSDGPAYDLLNYIHTFVSDPLVKLFNPIPADVTSLLTDFATKLLNGENIGLVGEAQISQEDRVLNAKNIMDIFRQTRTDVPDVQNMYQEALALWGASMNVYERHGGEK